MNAVAPIQPFINDEMTNDDNDEMSLNAVAPIQPFINDEMTNDE